GDVIVRVDGESAAAKRARLAPYIPHSTPQSLDALVARGILSGTAGTARVTVQDSRGRLRELTVPRSAEMMKYLEFPRSGPALRLLPGNIGYADLSLLTVPMVDSMFTLFKQTTAIIFDDRGYPQGTGWAIASRLTARHDVAAARFDRRLVISPDSTSWSTTSFVQYLPTTTKPRYLGKTVVLVDERSLSQAEHTVLFLEAANHTRIIGSPTMGANGDVTNVVLPGGVMVYFTGQSVRHADGRVLQRTGIHPDITVRPTLKGIRAGRDEVLDRAIRYLRSTAAVKQ
ncbi:MAG: S41 family peptidase, partial [Gemmatimonadales bacterium]